MSVDNLQSCSVTELKGMFGPAVRTVSIEEMNRAVGARGAEALSPQGTEGAPAGREGNEDEVK